MSEQFQAYRRSQIWLGEPDELAAHRQEGEQIASRLQSLSEPELYAVAADANEQDRVRWEATLRLPGKQVEQLANELVQRDDDNWWASMVRLSPPSETADVIQSLHKHLDSPDTRLRHRAMQLLSRFGEESLISRVLEMLKSDDKSERLVAVTCLEARNSQESHAELKSYIANESNPINTRIRAATSLLRQGYSEYADTLTHIALHEQSRFAYNAACGILHHLGKRQGLELFAHILLKGSHPAAPITVLHVAQLMGNYEQGFESSGLDKSRRWLKSQLSDTPE